MVVGAAHTTSRPEPARNARGVIAENYYDLQSLGLVERARADRDFEPASAFSHLRTLLQAAEIALYNLADLLRRAADGPGQVVKLGWIAGFHRVLVALGAAGSTFTAAATAPGSAGVRLRESPAFREYVDALRRFDDAVRNRAQTGTLDLAGILDQRSTDSAEFRIVHLARIANHQSTIWERSLLTTADPAPDIGHAELIASSVLREGVYEHRLAGDTYFTQFRALHQIPELLAAEINDRLEAGIRRLRDAEPESALGHLCWANSLAHPAAACLPPMIDNLATSDYHEIRENLGLTSGSHSVGIRYHMFTDLYDQLCAEIVDSGALEGALAPLFRSEVAAFRSFVFGWRDQHLHLPRNNLGGASTRSLTGSPDAVSVVRGMSEHARHKDPGRSLLTVPASDATEPELASYLAEPGSLDALLLTVTGHVTQGKFADVQERLGFFAQACPFTKPARRSV
jgi:hypothetical protein